MPASRSLYRNIAEVISSHLANKGWFDMTPEEKRVTAMVMREIAIQFKVDNPNFSYDKFYEACGLDSYGFVRAQV